MAQQTAVEWLYSHLFPKQLDGFSDEEWAKIDKAFEQAKQMEKEQIKESYGVGRNDGCAYMTDGKTEFEGSEQYYNKIYGNEGV